MEMIKDALSPERLEKMRKMFERELDEKSEASRVAELGASLKRQREDEEERRDRENWEKKIRKYAGVR